MNAFAHWMFSALLADGIANRIWNSVSEGKSWFASLLSAIWLPLLLIIAVCTLLISLFFKAKEHLRKQHAKPHVG